MHQERQDGKLLQNIMLMRFNYLGQFSIQKLLILKSLNFIHTRRLYFFCVTLKTGIRATHGGFMLDLFIIRKGA